jgi:peptide/nickel transport system substrate-binding protein
MSKRIITTIGLMLVVLIAVLWVAGDASAGTKLGFKILSDPLNYDVPYLRKAQDRAVAQQIYQGLVTFDVAAKPPYPVIPVLAKNYEVSKDAKVITFRLHEGVQFHHGYGELTSGDVVFTLQRHMDPKVASRVKALLKDVERIEALDRYTVRIHLKIPSAYTLLQNLAWQTGFIQSKKAITELGDKAERMPIGTGPYYFDRWVPGEKIFLKKFAKYWRTPARIDEIDVWIIPEEIVALGALEKGDLDVVPLVAVGSLERAKTVKGAVVKNALGEAAVSMTFINHKMKPLDDIRVRRAFAHALDIKKIGARIGDMVVPNPSPLPPAVLGATTEFWRYEYDLEKAKQLLAEAGHPNGFEVSMIYQKRGLYEPLALEVKRSLEKINVRVKLQVVDRGVFFKVLFKWNHHLAQIGLSRMANFLYAQQYLTGAPQNYSQYSNPEVNEAIEKARTATSEEEAIKYWREFQRLVTEDVVNLWICSARASAAIRKNVKGAVLLPYPGIVALEKAYIE